MKGHTRGTSSLEKGSSFSKLTKQKLNITSSTEVELVGTFDLMLKILWVNYFLEAQGYSLSSTVVYQDNQFAVLLEKNGKYISSKKRKHINVRYYFIRDCWKKGEIDIQYCPSETMVADFLTKPLQGKMFFKFSKIVVINTALSCCLGGGSH